MPAEHDRPRIYHIAPWRYLWIWFIFGPLILVFLGAGIFSHALNDRIGFLFGGAMFLAVTLFIHILVRWARLEVSEKGVRLRQSGYRLEAPWHDIVGMRLDRGHEGFVTSQPVGGKGAALLALASGATGSVFIGMSIYDGEQLTLLNEHRLIPIEAFAWYLRHGQLRADLERLAPQLRPVLARLDAPASAQPSATPHEPAPHPPRSKATFRQWAIFILLILSLAALLAFAFTSKSHEQIVYRTLGILFPASLAVSIGLGARGCFRIGSWLAGTGLALVTILLGLWAFAEAFNLAEKLGAGRPFMQTFATLFFGLLALRMASGTRNAFRHHSWVLGVVFLLIAVFLALCAVVTALDFTKPH